MIIIQDDMRVVNEKGTIIGYVKNTKLHLETHRDYIITYEIAVTQTMIDEGMLEQPIQQERAIKL